GKRRRQLIRKAFVMHVYSNKHEEYERRHTEIWPEMLEELRNHGASNYSVFLDEETSKLFGYVEIEDEEAWIKMDKTTINQKWWTFMEPVMETNTDNTPVSKELKQVFH